MRAVQITRFGGPEVMDIVDLPDPVAGDGQPLYEVSSAGINFADTHRLAVCGSRSAPFTNSLTSSAEMPVHF